jgi:hypothetical protein
MLPTLKKVGKNQHILGHKSVGSITIHLSSFIKAIMIIAKFCFGVIQIHAGTL